MDDHLQPQAAHLDTRAVTPPQGEPAIAAMGDRAYHLLVDAVRDYAIFMLTPTGHIASWNRGAQLIKGYTDTEIIGRHFSVFYEPQSVAVRWPEQELEFATRDGRFEDEGWRLRKDGSRFWANVVITAIPGPDGRLLGFAKVTRDLTERRLMVERLRQSEERFRTLVERVKDYAIFMLDTDGRISSWNAGAERIKGYTASEIQGKSLATFYPRADIEAGKPWAHLERARAFGSTRDVGWRVRKDGTLFRAEVTITALYDDLKQLRGYAKVTRDLTQLLRLESLVSEGQRSQEFLAILAHELRNPLAPISNALQLWKRDALRPDQVAWCRDVIDRNVQHLGRLVDDLLDISRLTSGKIALRVGSVDVAGVIARAVEITRPLIDERGHRLDVRLPPGPVHMQGDATRLIQVVANLLNNAAKYTPNGGEIVISASANQSRVRIAVRDNGMGIAPELLGNLFELFSQGPDTLERSEGGLGIGLSLVRRLVEMHGGTVEARSDGPGQGSEFVIELPVPAAAQRGAHPA